MMNYITRTRVRNRRLRNMFRRERELNPQLSDYAILSRVVHRPVPGGYFMSVEYARRRLAQMESGKVKACNEPIRQMMWEEISRAVRREMLNTGCSRCQAICTVIATGTASRFFITMNQALRILSDDMKLELSL